MAAARIGLSDAFNIAKRGNGVAKDGCGTDMATGCGAKNCLYLICMFMFHGCQLQYINKNGHNFIHKEVHNNCFDYFALKTYLSLTT